MAFTFIQLQMIDLSEKCVISRNVEEFPEGEIGITFPVAAITAYTYQICIRNKMKETTF